MHFRKKGMINRQIGMIKDINERPITIIKAITREYE